MPDTPAIRLTIQTETAATMLLSMAEGMHLTHLEVGETEKANALDLVIQELEEVAHYPAVLDFEGETTVAEIRALVDDVRTNHREGSREEAFRDEDLTCETLGQ